MIKVVEFMKFLGVPIESDVLCKMEASAYNILGLTSMEKMPIDMEEMSRRALSYFEKCRELLLLAGHEGHDANLLDRIALVRGVHIQSSRSEMDTTFLREQYERENDLRVGVKLVNKLCSDHNTISCERLLVKMSKLAKCIFGQEHQDSKYLKERLEDISVRKVKLRNKGSKEVSTKPFGIQMMAKVALCRAPWQLSGSKKLKKASSLLQLNYYFVWAQQLFATD